MSDSKNLPLSGYALTKVFTPTQELRPKEASADVDRQGTLNVGWDWSLCDDGAFDVQLSVAVEPTAQRPEYFAATLVGRFREVGEGRSVEMPEFARLQAGALLLPYVRQLLSNLTSFSLYGGPFYMPPLNVVTMMTDFNPQAATGAQQLKDQFKKGAPPRTIAETRRVRPQIKHK